MNNEVLYRVIFSGQAQPPVTPEQLQTHLAQRFKLPPDKAQAMMGRGDVLIKKHLSKEEAQRYLAALQQIGAVARLEVEAPQASSQAATPPPAATPAATPAAAADRRSSQEAEAAHNPYAAPRARVADVETTEYGELRVLTVQGRIGRMRYLVWGSAVMLGIFAVGVALAMLLGGKPASSLSPGVVVVMIVFVPLVLYPGICIQAQRLHDIGISAWFMLIGIIPFVGGLFNFGVTFWPGNKDENTYGLPPPPNSTAVKVVGWLLIIVLCISIIGIIAAVAIPAYQMQR